LAWDRVAQKLTTWENPRTLTDFENSLIIKSFLFKMVNSYSSFIYLAFIKRYSKFGGCSHQYIDSNGIVFEDCLPELRIQLATVVIFQTIIVNASKILVPVISEYLETFEDRKSEKEPSCAEEEYDKVSYSTFSDFDSLVLQYGYVAMFSVALPLLPFIALASNIISVRLNASEMTLLCRRPIPRGASDIGLWMGVLDLVSVLAIFTNVGIVCFETNRVQQWSYSNPEIVLGIAVISEHVLFAIKILVAAHLTRSTSFDKQQARQEYIVDVLLHGVEDSSEELLLDDSVGQVTQIAPSVGDEINWEAIPKDMKTTGHEPWSVISTPVA